VCYPLVGSLHLRVAVELAVLSFRRVRVARSRHPSACSNKTCLPSAPSDRRSPKLKPGVPSSTMGHGSESPRCPRSIGSLDKDSVQSWSVFLSSMPVWSNMLHCVRRETNILDNATALEGHELSRQGATAQGSRELFHHFETDKTPKPAVYKLLTGGVVHLSPT
jgi:hypothetical protein